MQIGNNLQNFAGFFLEGCSCHWKFTAVGLTTEEYISGIITVQINTLSFLFYSTMCHTTNILTQSTIWTQYAGEISTIRWLQLIWKYQKSWNSQEWERGEGTGKY